MVIFILHPLGRTVWFYSLFWFIPIIIYMFVPHIEDKLVRRRSLIVYLYALAATYIDHAMGSIIFGLFIFNVLAKYWIMSIPWVPIERAVFALGITLLYLFFKAVEKAFTTYIIIGVLNVGVVYEHDKYEEREKDKVVVRRAL